ncbi:hypothetical protein BJ741DRAFT_630613 [Chytriomyces cf. hyalinus JEL632]|nr:hypothetical protein BJ741DRAFT_630613 [Chytriomyces cf. hyalinus JEL632]
MCHRNRPRHSHCNSSANSNQQMPILILPFHEHPQQSPRSHHHHHCHSMRRSASLNPTRCNNNLLSPIKMVKNQIRQIANEVQELLSSRLDAMQPSTSSKQTRVHHGDVVYAPVSVQSATVAQQGQLGMMDTRQHGFSSGASIRAQGPGRDEDILPPYKEFDSKSSF